MLTLQTPQTNTSRSQMSHFKSKHRQVCEKKKEAINTTNILDSTSRAKRKSTPYIDFTRSASVKLPRLIYFIVISGKGTGAKIRYQGRIRASKPVRANL